MEEWVFADAKLGGLSDNEDTLLDYFEKCTEKAVFALIDETIKDI